MARRTPDVARSFRVCDVLGCGERIPKGQLACRKHWSSLPGELRNRIAQTWRDRHRIGVQPHYAALLEARRFLAGNRAAELTARIVGEAE